MLNMFHGRFLMYEYMPNGSLKDHLHSMFPQLLNPLMQGRESEIFFMKCIFIICFILFLVIDFVHKGNCFFTHMPHVHKHKFMLMLHRTLPQNLGDIMLVKHGRCS